MSPDDRFVGKSIPQPQFGNDDGSANEVLMAALDQHAGGGPRQQVLKALIGARVFVPVAAVLDSHEIDNTGAKVEKDSHMATVSLQTADGRRALLAFTSTIALSNWDLDARPIAAYFSQVCAAGCEDGADGVILDLAQGRGFGISQSEMKSFATRTMGLELIGPLGIAELVTNAVAQVAAKYRVTFEMLPAMGDDHFARLVVVLPAGLEPGKVLPELAAELAGDSALCATIPSGLELTARPDLDQADLESETPRETPLADS